MIRASLVFAMPLIACAAVGSDIPLVSDVEAQPLAAQVDRVQKALEVVGEPLKPDVAAALQKARELEDPAESVRRIQEILDEHVLVAVEINPESRVKVQRGPAKSELIQNGWRNFLVKVINSAGVTAELHVKSPNAEAMLRRTDGSPDPPVLIKPADVRNRFLDIAIYDARPLEKNLSGLAVEYRILQVYCRDAGPREANLAFDVGQGTQDLGFRAEVGILFDAKPATKVIVHVRDADGSPTTGWFVFRDSQGRVYPSQARRLAPDFFFHPQVYRADGEFVLLPPGKFSVTYSRGPEYWIETKEIDVPEGATHRESFDLKRWIHLKEMGWWSGDHHIHAAGCAHYDNPTKGVLPEDMFRHCVGQDLNVGCVLSWGPCWYYQKGFFEGKTHLLSLPNYIMRYDVEVSGFPSSHAGHLCLLNLKDDDYPGTEKIEQWPSWDLPVLKWGKEQGGVVGFSHSGWGLKVDGLEVPNYEVPKFDGIGANEYVVDVVHDVCDFISAVDTPITWELNVWYHTLNCGYRAKLSGETDFPCIYGERVGLGRGYVKLDGPLTFEKWVAAIKAGRSYVTDGLSHLIDFQVDGMEVGSGDGVLRLDDPKTVKATLKVAALLAENPNDPEAVRVRATPIDQQPYWHVERARIGESRNVPVEIIVNGYPQGRATIAADGSIQDVSLDVRIDQSSWVAARIFGSSHTNPVFIEVAGKPIRASRRSADWCIKAVDQCWLSKSPLIRSKEKADAKAAYDQARAAYQQALAEAVAE